MHRIEKKIKNNLFFVNPEYGLFNKSNIANLIQIEKILSLSDLKTLLSIVIKIKDKGFKESDEFLSSLFLGLFINIKTNETIGVYFDKEKYEIIEQIYSVIQSSSLLHSFFLRKSFFKENNDFYSPLIAINCSEKDLLILLENNKDKKELEQIILYVLNDFKGQSFIKILLDNLEQQTINDCLDIVSYLGNYNALMHYDSCCFLNLLYFEHPKINVAKTFLKSRLNNYNEKIHVCDNNFYHFIVEIFGKTIHEKEILSAIKSCIKRNIFFSEFDFKVVSYEKKTMRIFYDLFITGSLDRCDPKIKRDIFFLNGESLGLKELDREIDENTYMSLIDLYDHYKNNNENINGIFNSYDINNFEI